MKRKFLKQLLVYSVCACMTFLAIPVLADSTTPTTISNEAIKTILADEVVPTSWDIVTESYILNSNDKTLDISSLPGSEEKTIQIPNSVSSIAIKGDSTKTYNLSIIVTSRITPLNLIIKDLKIKSDRTGIDVTGNTNLILTGENSIVSNKSNGIAVYTDNALVIDADINTSSLTIKAGNNSAGIGGRFYTEAGAVKKGNGKITIKGGTINVTGGDNAAAIGGATGEESKLEDIIIEGGIITATGGNGGAGIGSGKSQVQDAGKIIINGGEIVATGGAGGAGIGSGADLNNGKPFDIEITGGKITGLGQSGGAGIGGANNSPIGNITISKATVTATGSNGGAGIGAGSKRAKDIMITGGAQITATGGIGGAGIGGGSGSEAIVDNITINGAFIMKAEGGTNGSKGGAGIGGGDQSSFIKLIISESKGNTTIEKAIGGYGSAGIGSGSNNGGGGACEIFIEGGIIVEAIGGTAGAGIGGGNERGCKITITGTTTLIKLAQGGSQAAGIGSGPKGDAALAITIRGGKIEDAIGGDYGAGIGGGESRGQIIVITSGYIENAQGGKQAAGIGGGKQGQEGSVTMTGGIVYAQAGAGAHNAIGAGEYPSSEQEESRLQFKVSGGDVFMNGDAKGFIPGAGYIKIYFKLYSNWVAGNPGASTVHADKQFFIKEVMPAGVGANGKQQYELVFNAEEGMCSSNGIITTILNLPNYDEENNTFNTSRMDNNDFGQLDEIFHGYWFQYTEGDVIKVGHPATPASKTDWNIIFETKKVQEEGSNKERVVDDHSKLTELTIPIKFVDAASTPEPITIGTVDNSQSKIVPYSVSNLSFLIPTAGETNLIEVQDLSVEMDFGNITSDISSEKAKITWGVWDKGNYSSTLTNSIKTLNLIQDSGSKKLKLTYPSSMLKTDDFIISLFIPTKHFENDPSKNQEIGIYKNVSNAAHKIGKKEDVIVTINMKAKVVTKEEIRIPGIPEVQYVPGQKVIDLPTINTVVQMQYADFTKIN